MGVGTSSSSIIRVNDRVYRWPDRPLVVLCLDGSSFDYLREAVAAGVAPYIAALLTRRLLRMVDAAMPTFTNPNNISIVTGVPPARHGICGNFFLNRDTAQVAMMNHASLLRAETILAAFSRAGAKVVAITAKDELRDLLSAGLNGVCVSAEQEGQPVYSARPSEHVLERGVDLIRSIMPDLTYLSTSDYIQHTHAPGAPAANRFYAAIDQQLALLDRMGVTLIITADHGMNAKTDSDGRPRVLFLQTLLDEWLGQGLAQVVLPITDPYVTHHGSLGSFATIYLSKSRNASDITKQLRTLRGVDVVLDRGAACDRFELPPDRIGDIVISADAETVLGTRRSEHDLSELRAPLRSHGGLAEREVPMLFNRPLNLHPLEHQLKNYDAFFIGLNAMDA